MKKRNGVVEKPAETVVRENLREAVAADQVARGSQAKEQIHAILKEKRCRIIAWPVVVDDMMEPGAFKLAARFGIEAEP